MRRHHRQATATTAQRMNAESGMATAEFAVALPAVVLVLTLILATVGYLIQRNEALHAASVGARLAARGESDPVITQGIRSAGGTAAATSLTRSGGYVRVSVHLPPPRMLGWVLPAVEGHATALDEKATP